jgi:hypothetical protein
VDDDDEEENEEEDEEPLFSHFYVPGGEMERRFQALVTQDFYDSVGDDCDIMEEAGTQISRIVERCMLPPGLRPWYEHGKQKTLKVCVFTCV